MGAGVGQIEVETVGDVAVVSLIGEFDMANAERLQRDLEVVAGSGRGLVVSLMGTEFLDSHGVHALYRADRTLREHGRELVLQVNTASIVRRVLEITALATEVHCTASLEDAISIAGRVEQRLGSEDTVTLALSVRAPGEVRSWLEKRYVGSMERSLLDDVTLLTSEVVTNAVQHSGCPEGDPLIVQASVADNALRIEVTDQGLGVVQLTPRSMEPPSGLGFVQLVSDRWSSSIGTFHVWFEIDVVTLSVLHRAPA